MYKVDGDEKKFKKFSFGQWKIILFRNAILRID